MKPFVYTLVFVVGFLLFLSAVFYSQKKTNIRPNIVYILADDIGYGDEGDYGQKKIEIPNFDALAKNGMMFIQFYAMPVSAAVMKAVVIWI